jgi:hypothetical protein
LASQFVKLLKPWHQGRREGNYTLTWTPNQSAGLAFFTLMFDFWSDYVPTGSLTHRLACTAEHENVKSMVLDLLPYQLSQIDQCNTSVKEVPVTQNIIRSGFIVIKSNTFKNTKAVKYIDGNNYQVRFAGSIKRCFTQFIMFHLGQ